MQNPLDLVLRQAVVSGWDLPVDIGVSGGLIAAVEPRLRTDAPEVAVDGRLVVPGFVDTHVHLDKACLLDRCGHVGGGLAGAIRAVSALKRPNMLSRSWVSSISIGVVVAACCGAAAGSVGRPCHA